MHFMVFGETLSSRWRPRWSLVWTIGCILPILPIARAAFASIESKEASISECARPDRPDRQSENCRWDEAFLSSDGSYLY